MVLLLVMFLSVLFALHDYLSTAKCSCEVLSCVAEGDTEIAKKTAESILKYFSGFDAFSLPPPACDEEVIKNLNDEKSKPQINPKFLKEVEDFKAVLHLKLSPKRSIKKGEFVTGEALAALIQLFVEALNTPGAVPNVQNAWDTFVQTKCSEVLADAVKAYEQEMTSLVEKEIPCEADLLRSAHDKVMEKCLKMFHDETFSLSIKSVDKYLQELTDKTNSTFSSWLEKNSRETKTVCTELIKKLKNNILDPVLARLRSPEGSTMQFGDIVAAYNEIQQKYSSNARGAKDVQAAVFMDLHPELQKEMEQDIKVLQKMKDYDESLAKEKADKAALEEEKQKIEEEKARIEKEKRDKEREMGVLQRRQEEEQARLRELYEKNLKDQREQLTNMMEANFEQQRKEREAALIEKMIEIKDREMKDQQFKLAVMAGQQREIMRLLLEKVDSDKEMKRLKEQGGCLIQ